jgi:DNA-binding beta-propeller fold protein YncE
LFLGLALAGLLAGCGPSGAPRIIQRFRIGLGACGMSLDASGARLAVVCRRSNDVWVLGLPSGALEERIDTLPKPRAVFFHPEDESFYVAEGLSSVAQVRLSDRRVARSFRPPWRVGDFAYEAGTRRLFCGHVGLPTLGVYRLKDMHLETTEAVGGEVESVAFEGRNAWVVTRDADALVRISLKDMGVKAAALAGPEPRGLALDAPGGLAYIACHGRAGEAAALSVPTPAPTEEVLSPISPSASELGAGGEEDESGTAADQEDASDDAEGEAIPAADAAAFHRYDGSGVAVARLDEVRRVDYIAVPGGPVAALLSPSRTVLALACEDGTLRLLDLASRRVVASLDLGGRPGAMAADPDGKSLLIALSSDKVVEQIRPGEFWR